MGPIVDAVKYTIENSSSGLETDWVHHILGEAHRKAWLKHASFLQHKKDALSMKLLVAEALLRREGF